MGRSIDGDELMLALERKKCGPATARYTDGFNDAIMRVRSMVHSALQHPISPDTPAPVEEAGFKRVYNYEPGEVPMGWDILNKVYPDRKSGWAYITDDGMTGLADTRMEIVEMCEVLHRNLKIERFFIFCSKAEFRSNWVFNFVIEWKEKTNEPGRV